MDNYYLFFNTLFFLFLIIILNKLFFIMNDNLYINYYLKFLVKWGLGIGDWGLGIGDWEIGRASCRERV